MTRTIATLWSRSRATGEDAFTYQKLNAIASDTTTSAEATASLGGSNRGYLMLDLGGGERTDRQKTHGPICQQCHEDTRDAGVLLGASAAPAPFTPSLEGTSADGNPRFQNFPHETVGASMLVAPKDTLCENCHAS